MALDRWLSCSVWLPPAWLGYLHMDSVCQGPGLDGVRLQSPLVPASWSTEQTEPCWHLPGKEEHLFPRAIPVLCVDSTLQQCASVLPVQLCFLSSPSSCAVWNSSWLCTLCAQGAKGIWGGHTEIFCPFLLSSHSAQTGNTVSVVCVFFFLIDPISWY